MRKVHLLFGLGLLLPLAALAWWQGWFAKEPVYHGRTVTGWLDAMTVYNEVRDRDESDQNASSKNPTREMVAADPALPALLAMGSQTVPALRSHLIEPPTPPSWPQRLRRWSGDTWGQLQDPKYAPPPVTLGHSSRDQARSLSAGLALLALGTNRNGGLPVLMEEFARANGSTNLALRSFMAQGAIDTALIGFPELRTEMRDTIDRGLTHTNPLYRQFAARNALVRRFPEDFPRWHPVLIHLVASDQEDPQVRDGAMVALLVRPHTDDPEFVALCVQVFTNKASARLLRARATGGLRFGGSSNLVFLSLMRGATNDADGYVKQSARIALRDFEKHPQQ